MSRDDWTGERRLMAIAYIGDRRANVRFQVVGTMPVSMLVQERFEIVDVGTNGALLEGRLPLPVNAEYRMQLVLEGHTSEANIKVRRVTHLSAASGSRYRIGIEFLALSPDAQDLFDGIVAADAEGVEPR